MEKMFDYKEIATGLKKGYQDMLFNGSYCEPSEVEVNEMQLSEGFIDMVSMGKNAIIYFLKDIMYSRLEKDDEEQFFVSVADERVIAKLVKFAIVIDEEFYSKIDCKINEFTKAVQGIDDEFSKEDMTPSVEDNTSELIKEFLFNEMIDFDFITLLDYFKEDITTDSDEWDNLEEILMNINDTLDVLESYIYDEEEYEKLKVTLLKTERFSKTYEDAKAFLMSEGEHVVAIEDIDGLDMYKLSLEPNTDFDSDLNIETESSYLVYDNSFKQFIVEQNVYDNNADVDYKVECGYDEEGDEIIFNIYKNLEAVCEIGSNTKGFLIGNFIPYFTKTASSDEEAQLFATLYVKIRELIKEANEELASIGIGSFEDFGIIL